MPTSSTKPMILVVARMAPSLDKTSNPASSEPVMPWPGPSGGRQLTTVVAPELDASPTATDQSRESAIPVRPDDPEGEKVGPGAPALASKVANPLAVAVATCAPSALRRRPAPGPG